MVGLSRFELLTPRLSSVCSNQLSYRPSSGQSTSAPLLHELVKEPAHGTPQRRSGQHGPIPSKLDRRAASLLTPCEHQIDLRFSNSRGIRSSRKEVIQPQVLLQLPCYDFTPITDHTLGTCFPCGLAQRLLVQPAFVM